VKCNSEAGAQLVESSLDREQCVHLGDSTRLWSRQDGPALGVQERCFGGRSILVTQCLDAHARFLSLTGGWAPVSAVRIGENVENVSDGPVAIRGLAPPNATLNVVAVALHVHSATPSQ
jgi:hypothetical protein